MYPKQTLILITTTALLSACESGSQTAEAPEPVELETTAPAVTFKPEATTAMTTSKPGAPVRIRYRIIGKPVVGQPVAVELLMDSAISSQPIEVSYRVNDVTAMEFPTSQAATLTIAPARDTGPLSQQVTVVPLREGRVFLNVAADIKTDAGILSSVTAIPIQVGPATTVPTQENGTLSTDENGEAIRVVPAGD